MEFILQPEFHGAYIDFGLTRVQIVLTKYSGLALFM